jgi:hypothetical protein
MGLGLVAARELRPVLDDSVVVVEEPAVHEQRDYQRLHELRGRGDELDRVGVVRFRIAGANTKTTGQPHDRLAAHVDRNGRADVPRLREEGVEYVGYAFIPWSDGATNDVVHGGNLVAA